MARRSVPLNFWQLTSILGPALGLPAMIIGGQLATAYGPASALSSIVIGNFVLWLIGFGIISVSNGRNAMENIGNYLGKTTTLVASLVTILAFILWFALQVKGASVALSELTGNSSLSINMALGLLAALLSFWGLKGIKAITLLTFPILITLTLIALFTSKLTNPLGLSFSFYGVIAIILMWLPFTINLPTFFRHSTSKADSLLALSLLTAFHMFFQIATVLLGIDSPLQLIAKFGSAIILPGFIFTAYIVVNLANIYCASAGWETIFPHHRSAKEYAIVGIAGTLVSTSLLTFDLLETIATSVIVTLGVVLIFDVILKLVVKHRPRPQEKLLSNLCWLIGAITSSVNTSISPQYAFVTGIGASALTFLVIIFIEETIWSLKKLHLQVK